MTEEKALDLETRKRIFEYVSLNPGVHFRELQRSLDLPVGALDYHVKYLEKHELLATKQEGHYTRYYPRNRFDPSSKSILAFLRQDLPRGIIIFLLKNPRSTHGGILVNFRATGATLSYHLKRMSENNLLKAEKSGRETFYEISEPEKVADLLVTYRRSFMDELVESFAAAWTALK